MEKGKCPVEDVAGSSGKKKIEQKFVWPWCGLVANLPTEIENHTGRRVGKSGSTLRDDLILKGFNPTRVQPIWNYNGHSGYALVEFTKDFQGFDNAMRFQRSYESDHHGKKDWEKGPRFRDDKLYGWVAREDDYNGGGPVGKMVRKKRDLKSVSQLEAEDDRKMKALVKNISESIEVKKICKEELEKKVESTSQQCSDNLELHDIQLNETYKQEVEKMDMNVRKLYQQILEEHKESMLGLERKQQELEKRARQIEKQANINEAEMQKSRLLSEMNQRAMWVQNEANEEAMKLAEKHQKEKEKLHEKIKAMNEKLNETQELELEIEKLKGNASVMNLMAGGDADTELIDKLAKTQIDLDAREAALHEKMMTLSQKERETNDEYQDARKELIKFWNENENLVNGEKIRMKRMGQLNPEPFLPAVKRKHRALSDSKADMKALELCSLWEGHIGDVQWHPFKVQVNESDGTTKRVVDQNDEKLVKLKKEYGEGVYKEVVRAKLEIEEYNASGSYVIQELWNHEENRKATMEESTDVMLKIMLKIKLRLDLANKKKKRLRL